MDRLSPDPAGDEERDDRGRGQALSLAPRSRPDRHRAVVQDPISDRAIQPGWIDHHPAACPQHLSNQQPDIWTQDQGSDPGARARTQVFQEPDPRALSQPGLFRRRSLWHRCREPDFLRPSGNPHQPGRGDDHRRAGQGPVELFADRRRRGGAGPRRRGSKCDGQERLHHPGTGRQRRSRADRRAAEREAEQHSLFYRLGTAAARHADRRDQRPDRRLDHARHADAGSGRPRNQRQFAAWGTGRPGCARSRRCGPGDDRRQGLCQLDLQSRDPGPAPAGIRVQAVRLSRRSGERNEADYDPGRRADYDRRLDPAQFDPVLPRPSHAS